MVEENAQNGNESANVPPTIDEQLQSLIDGQAAHRAEVAELRTQLDAQAAARSIPQPQSQQLTPEQQLDARMSEIEQSPYYCHVCGRLYKRETECSGTNVAPHPPVEVISTDELKSGDPANHTAAPATDR